MYGEREREIKWSAKKRVYGERARQSERERGRVRVRSMG